MSRRQGAGAFEVKPEASEGTGTGTGTCFGYRYGYRYIYRYVCLT
jgi:hypothetical protein